MPGSVRAHYDDLLAEHYEWMFGVSFEEKVAEQQALLREIAGHAPDGDLAVDLGCGPGYQSLALSQLGYRVLALDTSERLAARLSARIGARRITLRLADMRNLDEYVAPATVGVAVCMGDTLTHLPGRDDVTALFKSVARALRPRGVFVATYRDLSGAELRGLDRFIPVRGDDRRVMTCVLEYSGPETVVVTDLVHVRDEAGLWSIRKSSYPKLRLPLEWVREQLGAAGLSIAVQRSGPLVTLAAINRVECAPDPSGAGVSPM